MVVYKKIKRKYDVGYTRDNVFIKGSRVPEEVKERLEITDHMDYDDQPNKPRCLFCEAPATRQRIFEGVMVDMDEFHYYAKNIGQIAQELREQKEAQDVQQKKSLGSTTKRNKRTKGKDVRKDPTPAGTPS